VGWMMLFSDGKSSTIWKQEDSIGVAAVGTVCLHLVCRRRCRCLRVFPSGWTASWYSPSVCWAIFRTYLRGVSRCITTVVSGGQKNEANAWLCDFSGVLPNTVCGCLAWVLSRQETSRVFPLDSELPLWLRTTESLFTATYFYVRKGPPLSGLE